MGGVRGASGGFRTRAPGGGAPAEGLTEPLREAGPLLALLGSFVGSAFALVRYALAQNRTMAERFVSFLEGSLRRQEEINERFQSALHGLTENVRENSVLLGRVAERMGIER